MNITLTHSKWLNDGIFGEFKSEDGNFTCETIEHAYPMDGKITSKIPEGTYTCQRRQSPHFGYDVFEVMNVPNCSYIEIHIANTEKDVIGCIGVGEELGTLNGMDAILQSGQAFKAFMNLQSGIDSFVLTVENAEAAAKTAAASMV